MNKNFQVLDGKKVSGQIKEDLKKQVSDFKSQWGRSPALHVVLVGSDPASQIYVGLKEKTAHELGFTSKVWRLDEKTSQSDLEKRIQQLVDDENVDGILVQMPLPKHLSEPRVVGMIPFEKDVDGFTMPAFGALAHGKAVAVSCTPAGVMEILRHYKINVEGMNCVVVGRSMIVGKPMAMLLMNANATVTVCHSKTKNLKDFTRAADLVVVAAGKPQFLGAEDFKKGAIVIDVGIHRDSQNKVCGDVRFDGLSDVVSAASPVPGGVGPMTIVMLMQNTLKLAQARMGNHEHGNS